jgi:hypothetical protein
VTDEWLRIPRPRPHPHDIILLLASFAMIGWIVVPQ